MSAGATVAEAGFESIDVVAPLWEALFDHHCSIGAAGFAVIPREWTWSLRRAHYERIFAGEANATLWVARRESTAVGYAVAFDELIDGSEGRILETLSVAPEARGSGLGTRLMAAFDGEVHRRGLVAALDVMTGNERAKSLYIRQGFEPNWSCGCDRDRPPARSLSGRLRACLSLLNGPDSS